MGSDPGPPLRLCPGDLTAPPDPQLARAMTFACRHDIIKNPTNFWWWWFEGGSHEIFTDREGGSTIFLLLPGGDQKFNRVFHPVSTTPPRELKNDNSLTVKSKRPPVNHPFLSMTGLPKKYLYSNCERLILLVLKRKCNL